MQIGGWEKGLGDLVGDLGEKFGGEEVIPIEVMRAAAAASVTYVPCRLSGSSNIPARSKHRSVHIQIRNNNSAVVTLGRTQATAHVRAVLAPPSSRHTRTGREGTLRFRAASAPHEEALASLEAGAARVLERAFVGRQRRALDLESLCVTAGKRVWHIEVALAITCADDGCATEALGIAAVAALRAFRRPEVSVDTTGANVTHIDGADDAHADKVVVHDPRDREPVPLSLLTQPLPFQFAVLDGVIIPDPTPLEVAAASAPRGAETGSEVMVVVNERGEVSQLAKLGGGAMSPDAINKCMTAASRRHEEIMKVIDETLASHEKAKIAARIRRHGAAVAASRKDDRAMAAASASANAASGMVVDAAPSPTQGNHNLAGTIGLRRMDAPTLEGAPPAVPDAWPPSHGPASKTAKSSVIGPDDTPANTDAQRHPTMLAEDPSDLEDALLVKKAKKAKRKS